MHLALIVVHVIACFAIIGIVLLQAGKGADIGSAFGGAGSQAVFGSMGTPTVLGKITAAIAAMFTITSFSLALLGGERGGDRKSTRLNSSHGYISYAVFCLKKKNIAVKHAVHER